MNEIELEQKLLSLGISVNKSLFKPSKTEIAVFEQLLKKFDEQRSGDNPGVLLKPFNTGKLTPL